MFDDRVEISNAIRDALNFLEEGDEDNVIAEVERVFSLDPLSPEAVHVLGLLAAKMNEPIRAKELFLKAAEIAPGKYEHSEALAIMNAKLGLLSDSLYYGKLAAALTPYEFISGFLPEWFGTFEDSFLNIQEKPHFKFGKYYYDRGHFQHAIEFLQKAAEVDPNDASAWRMLVHSLRICDRSYESLLMLKSLDNIGLNDPADLSEVALVLGDIGLFEESLSCHREVLNFDIENQKFFANFIVSLQKAGLVDETENAERDWATLFSEPIFDYDLEALSKVKLDKLRVGLVSGRFRSNSGLDHLWPLILNHGQPRLSFNCYSYNQYDDIISRKIAGSVSNWVDLSKIDDKTAATIIYNDEIDILIDLDSNLETSHPKVFSYKPSPVLLKYLGMPNSTHETGYAGVFGGSACYADKNTNGAIADFAFAGLSPEIKPDNLMPAKLINSDTLCVGLAPTGSELTPAFYEAIQHITSEIPNSKIILNTRHLGGGGLLDGIEKQLAAYNVLDKVKFTILDNDKYSAIAEFVAQCDVLVVLNHMRSVDVAWEFLNALKPVFSVESSLVHLREIDEVFTMLGHEDWRFDTIGVLTEELKKIDSNFYGSLTGRLCHNMQEQIGADSLNDRGRKLLKMLSDFRKEHLSSELKKYKKREV